MASPTLAGGMGKLAVSDDMLAAAAVLDKQGEAENEKQGETEDMSPLLENFAGLSVSTIPELEAVYDLLIRDHPTSVGKAASSAARQRMGLSLSTLVYGEIMFSSFAIAFEKLRNKYNLLDAGGIFYDIGAGTSMRDERYVATYGEVAREVMAHGLRHDVPAVLRAVLCAVRCVIRCTVRVCARACVVCGDSPGSPGSLAVITHAQ